jgi:hypothetical protein
VQLLLVLAFVLLSCLPNSSCPPQQPVSHHKWLTVCHVCLLQIGWSKVQELRRYIKMFRDSGKYTVCYMKVGWGLWHRRVVQTTVLPCTSILVYQRDLPFRVVRQCRGPCTLTAVIAGWQKPPTPGPCARCTWHTCQLICMCISLCADSW